MVLREMRQVNLTGGYYDAGDNVKYQFPMAFTITLLSWSVIEYRTEIQNADQLQYALRNIMWGTDYFLKAITGPDQIYVQVLILCLCNQVINIIVGFKFTQRPRDPYYSSIRGIIKHPTLFLVEL